jgi:hypothetical protein
MTESIILRSKDDLPKGAVRVHLYNSKNVLMPRGSMKKESIGLYLYDVLKGSYESWTDPKYGDNPDPQDLLTIMYKNLHHELECAWQALLAEIPNESN